jgi:Arc/MetJ-type ribon-helix-helix transcriptional regulator
MALCRTQISLSEAQRRFLQRLARQRRTSVSDVIRSLVDREMQTQPSRRPAELEEKLKNHPWKGDPLFDIIGMVSGDGTVTSENLDDHIYNKDW